MGKLKYIYFDVGGVLIIDFDKSNKWQELKDDLKVSKTENGKFDEVWKNNTQRACLDYNVDNLIPILEKYLRISFPDNYSLHQDIVDRFEHNESIWDVVNKAKEKYKLGMITNIYPGMLEKIHQKNLLEPIDWHAVVDSSVVGLQKPDNKIYKHAQDKSGVKPNEILFIDNMESNLDPVRKIGWQSFLYDPSKPEESSKLLSDYLKLT
ncbi:HAD family hydrolase [Patescibacteria group bacterium]